MAQTSPMVGRKAPIGAKCRWRRRCKQCRRHTRKDLRRLGKHIAKRKEQARLRQEINHD